MFERRLFPAMKLILYYVGRSFLLVHVVVSICGGCGYCGHCYVDINFLVTMILLCQNILDIDNYLSYQAILSLAPQYSVVIVTLC